VSPGISRAELAGFAEGSYDGIFAEASDCRLPVFVTIPGNAAMIERYALRYPECCTILCHCGMPPTRGNGQWLRNGKDCPTAKPIGAS